MIKKICLDFIRFEIGGLWRKLGWFRDVGLGRWIWQMINQAEPSVIRPINISYHFDTFDHIYWEINCFKLWQNWVETPYLTILWSEQFQNKIWICTIGKRWTHVFPIGKGLPDVQNHNFEQHQVGQGVLTMHTACIRF